MTGLLFFRFERWLIVALIVVNLLWSRIEIVTAAQPEAGVGGGDANWQPARTWVFCVGLLKWENPQYGPFPQKHRRDAEMLQVLKECGVPAAQITYLCDEQGTTAAIEKEFTRFLKQPAKDDLVIVYYCGHGYNTSDHKQTFLVSYDTAGANRGWEVATIPREINRLCRAQRVVIALDHCFSGAMAEAVRRLPNPKVSFAVLASAHHNSSSTGNWTFTENLISAFRGRGYMDDDGNGQITFSELDANIELDMAFAERQMSQSLFTKGFDPNFVIRASHKPTDPEIGQRTEIEWHGKYYRGFVIGRNGALSRVHYYGYQESDDEWVTPERLRTPTPVTRPINSPVEIWWKSEWYRGRIIGVKHGLHLVKYDKWGPEWNEWVTIHRLRDVK
ncbi:hypothetical protein Plim_2823 [Planctopirus limnophila DSM 3776]|uniref:Peptidase C14 caspase domain-containing protein n=1 Tax=Planctopirus limnophila (strain ATCC 43296 / DSM 3776 / IFAM 1008 / Mu 290) TaxID=521674 RepID=D5SRF2_PLAL2|nr:caspase family protein [Planctopirus limnophila]ADG68645.1 hypothetical protein Plim_2823 [Planctopirus limnophila DSM 3776]